MGIVPAPRELQKLQCSEVSSTVILQLSRGRIAFQTAIPLHEASSFCLEMSNELLSQSQNLGWQP